MICNKDTGVQKTALVFRVRQSRAQKYVWGVTVTPVVVVEAKDLGASCPTCDGMDTRKVSKDADELNQQGIAERKPISVQYTWVSLFTCLTVVLRKHDHLAHESRTYKPLAEGPSPMS